MLKSLPAQLCGGRDANLSHSRQYQPKVDYELFGRFLNLVTSSRLKWTHDCNPDGTGHIYKITVPECGRALRIKDELIKLGMEADFTQAAP